jgi:hypothetical protein
MKSIPVFFICVFLSMSAYATTETQTVNVGDNLEMTFIVVEMSQERGDLNRTNISQETVDPLDTLQEFSIVLPSADTPDGSFATIKGVLKIGDDIWT